MSDAELRTVTALVIELDLFDSPLYVASAIFDGNGTLDQVGYGQYGDWLRHNISQYKTITNRGLVLRELFHGGTLPSVEGLNSEQRALLDFLVLQRAEKVVGFAKSSFSFKLGEYRALVGHPRNTTLMVPGDDGNFRKAATFDV